MVGFARAVSVFIVGSFFFFFFGGRPIPGIGIAIPANLLPNFPVFFSLGLEDGGDPPPGCFPKVAIRPASLPPTFRFFLFGFGLAEVVFSFF